MGKEVESIKLVTVPLSRLESERAKAKKEGKREGGVKKKKREWEKAEAKSFLVTVFTEKPFAKQKRLQNF